MCNKNEYFRGYKIRLDESTNQFVFCDTGEPTVSTWQDRPCGHCNLDNTSEDHDGCLGTLPNVKNACCGHGETQDAYVQFTNGTELREEEAVAFFKLQRKDYANDK